MRTFITKPTWSCKMNCVFLDHKNKIFMYELSLPLKIRMLWLPVLHACSALHAPLITSWTVRRQASMISRDGANNRNEGSLIFLPGATSETFSAFPELTSIEQSALPSHVGHAHPAPSFPILPLPSPFLWWQKGTNIQQREIPPTGSPSQAGVHLLSKMVLL